MEKDEGGQGLEDGKDEPEAGVLFVVIGDFFDIKKLSRGGEFFVRAKSN